MRTILHSIIFLISCSVAIQAKAQCTPDANLTYNGIYPDQLPDGMAGVDYESVLSFKIPADSSISGISVTIDSTKFLYAAGKPTGFTFLCNSPTCAWAGGTKGCARFTGKIDSADHNAIKEYPMKVYTQTWYRFTGSPTQYTRIDSATNFVFRVVAYNGIAEINTYTTLKAYPNPTNGIVTIELRDIQNDANEVTIMDAFGKIVYTEHFDKPNRFLTTYTADLSSYKPGLYLVSLKSGDKIGLSRIMLNN
jgi:hypothetical protein